MIKLLAALTMLIDHIGMLFFPGLVFFRIIGRVSMPLFAYSIARGFFYTRSKDRALKYLRNVAILAAVSQIPFIFANYMVFDASALLSHLNICVTWSLSLALLILLESGSNRAIRIILIACVIFASVYIPVEYGLYGVLFPVLFYYTFFKYRHILFSVIGVSLLFIVEYITQDCCPYDQIFTLASIPIILIYENRDDKVKLPKPFFYIFYPGHLLALTGLFLIL